jgi:hypothetical protein
MYVDTVQRVCQRQADAIVADDSDDEEEEEDELEPCDYPAV